jgi:hypothetical protein
MADVIPKITDFGLAKLVAGDDGAHTQTGLILGTPSYMAPEQASARHGEIGPQADIYSLGAVFYELLVGHPPFRADSAADLLDQIMRHGPVPPGRLRPRLARDLETVCLKCLEKEPRNRYTDTRALAEDLRRHLDGRPIVARPISRPAQAWRWCRRNPWLATMGAAIVLLLLVVAAGASVAAWFLDEARREALELRTRAQSNEGAAQEQLRRSLVDHAAAEIRGNTPGRRARALELLARAASYGPDLKARNEAIACLALTDLQPGRTWEGAPPGTLAIAFDPRHERYARSSAAHSIQIRRVKDDLCMLKIDAPGTPAKQLLFSPDGRYLAGIYSPPQGMRHSGIRGIVIDV